ncbi:uncharacterized protein E5676_scaffold1932G00040 [Cucumis melo var. makuwa]|uniref:DUF863 domain-containing protein n=2 Tax=Cucumis melo TaxID=3656 RepID=A0A5A7SZ23_CUCMM|nr:uncharacterized protein E6C27_scaffold65G004630 [Cucumis melo var. makuwa]TYK17679.1 uncharacterized protein E5676_scaffold1932G00040 [Cucumis melo var. makuwa]
MGTKVQYESYLPGYHSMRDLNEDSHGCSWPLYYSEKSCQSGQYYNGILPRATSDAYLGCDRDAVKRTMLEHEAIFKNQVRELHRLYIKQRELMNDIKRSEQRHPIPVDISFSSSPLASQSTPDGARKWHLPNFPLAISSSGPSVPGVEDVKSSLSSLKENNRSDGLLPSQNGTSSKDCEVLESRHSNSRRKTFDLQLPADEYIDSEEGEVFHDEKVPPALGCHSNGSKKFETQSCVTANLNLNLEEKSGGQSAALRSDSCLWNRYGLADLNEPVQVEEANGSNFFDLPSARDSSNGETQGPIVSSAKQENFLSSSNEGGHATNRNSYIENGNRREAFPNIFEAGRSKESEKSFTRGQMEKFHLSSNPLQVPLNKYHELPVFYLNDKSKVQQDLDRPVSDLQLFKRSFEMSNAGDPGYVLASQTSRTYQIAPSLDVGKSWAHSSSSWEKSNGSQKTTSGHTQPCFNSSAAVHKSFPSSTLNNGIFGDRWHLSSDSRSNPGSGCENPNQNGFYIGSTSGSNGVLSSTIRHDPGANYYKGSGCVSTNSPKDINLNVVLQKSLSNESGQQPNYRTRESEQNNEDHHNVLPWSRAVPAASKNETINSRRFSVTGELNFALSPTKQFSDRNETENGSKVVCYPNIESNSHCSNNEPRMSEQGECQSNRKLLGFPIFEGPRISKNESFSLTSPSASLPNPSENGMEDNRKTRVLDINLPCDPSVFESDNATNGALTVENGKDTKISTVRVDIDLNSCVSDEEPSMRPLPLPSSSGKERVMVEIDLEAPAMPETEDNIIVEEESLVKQHEQQPQSLQHKAVDIQDDLMSLAAEAILAISSCGHSCLLDDSVVSNGLEDSSSDPLNWFAEIVSTHGDDVQTKSDTVLRSKEGKDAEESSLRGVDYFEYMTLRQAEVDEEHYMPKPLVPENMEIEDTGTNLLQNRPRKGQTRRGRQRRDFQKDILPGLSSLSRHEVTEDLQTFGGLMRATGHSWHSGVTRRNSTRNGCGRGRRRSVTSPPPPVQSACNQLIQQLSNIEMGLEDGSLTGWGKTTRRPRRQRCPAGNPPAVPLT